jgi:hypothetical protein
MFISSFCLTTSYTAGILKSSLLFSLQVVWIFMVGCMMNFYNGWMQEAKWQRGDQGLQVSKKNQDGNLGSGYKIKDQNIP